METIFCDPCVKPSVESVAIGLRKRIQGKFHNYKMNESCEYLCEYCDYTSKKKSTLSEHITRKHAEEAGRKVNPCSCDYCGEKFVAKTHLTHHIKNHHEIVYVACPHPDCGYKSNQTQSLCSHYAKHHMNWKKMYVELEGKMVRCLTCFKEMKQNGVAYHLSKCNPRSPFFNGSKMCDGGDDVIVYRGRNI
jgi:hypothetical protein